MSLNPEQRFLAKVEKTDSCWLWTASTDHGGYGLFGYEGRMQGAHRVAYKMFRGPIPKGLTIDHLCRVPACVKPDHLEAVTMRENILRGNGWAARNARKTECPKGHSYDFVEGGSRKCRQCRRETELRWYYRNKEKQRAGS